jgi:nucleoside phosphorylase
VPSWLAEMGQVLDFNHYTVAWIAPLQIEAWAAIRMLDKIHDGNFRSDPGDDYQYIGGEINGHNVVVATFPPGTQYGGASAAALAAQVRECFKRLWFGLLVGIAAGLPDLSRDPPLDIRLGDVLISVPDSDNTGIVQYDFGKQSAEGFENRSQQATTESIVRAAFGRIRGLAGIQGNTFLKNLKKIEDARDENGNILFKYPGEDMDHLYETGNEKDTLVQRDRREEKSRTRVWYGNIGSGNILMKSSRERDALRDMYKIIGLEMEAAGTMNTIHVGNIRGVCDYADVHKTKDWQGYAAAVASAYAREVLCTINPPEERKGQFNCF